MSPAGLVLALVVVAAGAFLQGLVGFGQSIVAAPFLLLVDDRLVPGPLLVAALAITVLAAWRERTAIDVAGFGWALTGRIPGVAAGTVAIIRLSSRGLGVLLAVVVLAATALSVRGGAVRRTPTTNLVAGFASGFGGTTTAIGGPPMALLYQDAPGPSLRATLAGFFAVGTAMSMVALAAVGELGRYELGVGAAFVPAVFLGFRLSSRFTSSLDARYLRPAVLVVSTAGALAVLVRSLL